ncbi:OLC1v1016024C1 [Oldenlandia corymbosa var. corymbosa]|uniref:OLC1v1016024C1 n=1 Tax=Oldenlandia corymbosa var. corymbosa TaxID=529605 RepID=A0AAV1E6K0_OLDCO|nr:OLC1v1016024C1 [Oldenlandia corymbosa var. corymbosa]
MALRTPAKCIENNGYSWQNVHPDLMVTPFDVLPRHEISTFVSGLVCISPLVAQFRAHTMFNLAGGSASTAKGRVFEFIMYAKELLNCLLMSARSNQT